MGCKNLTGTVNTIGVRLMECIWLRGAHGPEIKHNIPEIASYIGWSVRRWDGRDVGLTLDQMTLLDALNHRAIYWSRVAPGVDDVVIRAESNFNTCGQLWITEMRRLGDGRTLFLDEDGRFYWLIRPAPSSTLEPLALSEDPSPPVPPE